MTIDEWIEFAETKAKEHRERSTTCADDPEWVKYGKTWEKEYQQLAEWLRELKAYKDFEERGYVMCRFAVSQDDRQRITKMVLDFNTKDIFDNVVEVNADENGD